MRVHLKTLGCRLNEAEIESWANDFSQRGHQLVNEDQAPDVLVLNTCAVTQSAVRKSRQLVRRTHTKNPNAKLVVSGCYATLNKDETLSLDGVDLLVNNQQKDQLVDLTIEQLSVETMPSIATEPNAVALFSRGRQRAFIKVQDGCRYRCSFCIVTIARGDEKSRAIDDIIKEINSHMHLPMQSGSDAVLKRMSRRCKTDEFRSLVAEARALVPNLNITSDIIVGFPGETELEWQQTLAFVDEMQFADLHIFSYSPREGTKAASMPEQVRNELKKQRSKALHQLASNLKQQNMQAFIGSHCSILWEDSHDINDDGSYTLFGYTPN